jgi:hypothetical protein
MSPRLPGPSQRVATVITLRRVRPDSKRTSLGNAGPVRSVSAPLHAARSEPLTQAGVFRRFLSMRLERTLRSCRTLEVLVAVALLEADEHR